MPLSFGGGVGDDLEDIPAAPRKRRATNAAEPVLATVDDADGLAFAQGNRSALEHLGANADA